MLIVHREYDQRVKRLEISSGTQHMIAKSVIDRQNDWLPLATASTGLETANACSLSPISGDAKRDNEVL